VSYREPAKREPRLWLVALGYTDPADQKNTGITGITKWVWALESHLAIDVLRTEKGLHRTAIWFSRAFCGEDFLDEERKGPPKDPS